MHSDTSQAIVIGGSMAGLLTARVLSDHFDQVTIIERDKLPADATYRGGVPQARHLHTLLAYGEALLEDLFPGLGLELEDHGVPRIEWGMDTRFNTKSGWLPSFQAGLISHTASRTLLEWIIRKRVYELGNVTTCDESDVLNLLTEDTNERVIGVQVRSRATRIEHTLHGDLVVDASGRGSKTPEWLTEMGYKAPEETTVNAFLGYATRWYQVPDGVNADWTTMVIQARPDEGNYRAGGVFHVEDNQVVVTLAGANKDYPPTDEAAFLEYARTLPEPDVYNYIKTLEPTSPIYGYRRTMSRWRHYEQLPRMPHGFVVIGDAAVAFNPIYGQGMTTAAKEVKALQHVLETVGVNAPDFTPRFQKALAQAVKQAWLMATGEDLRYPETEGKQPNTVDRLTQRYIDGVFAAMPYDNDLAATFLRVMNLEKHAATLFQPAHLMSVVRHNVLAAHSTATE